ncbi:MAG: hypothetical protein U9R21_01845 [Candidatus Thermoplasmatota archaeon]|nr:hypothetical protein [Candidatus Thermoplasmatota archaeon]
MGIKELDQVTKIITKVREPGDQPSQSTTSFDLYECDLCKGDVEKSKLTQCPYCGRWVCKENCWNKKNLACMSCSSVIELSQRKGAPSHNGDKGSEKSNAKSAGVLKKIQQKIQKK